MSFNIGILKGLATVLLAAGFLSSCSDDACVSHTGKVCAEGNVYWVDSCGNYQELIEECRCGCRADRSECKRCDDCSCAQAGTCCDGCLPINENEFCDDGNPGTRLDLCQDGACAGWTFSVEEPALPTGPAAPEPVRLRSWTCPPGWSRVQHDSLLDETGQPVSNATVEIVIGGPETTTLNSNPSGADGWAEATWQTQSPNKKGQGGTVPGAYTASTTNITVSGYNWDSVTTNVTFTIQ